MSKKVDRRFSQVVRTIWSHPKFRRLSSPKPNAQTLVLRLLIAPEMSGVPGIFKAWDAALAADLGWPLPAFRKCLAEVVDAGWAVYDDETGVFWIPNALDQEANQPANPNVVRSWRTPLAELPDSGLKEMSIKGLVAWAESKGPTWSNALEEALGRRSPMPSPNPSGKQQPKDEPKALVEPLVNPSPIQEHDKEHDKEPPTPKGVSGVPPANLEWLTLPGSPSRSLEVPIARRCQLAIERKDLADYACAHEWPEVLEASAILAPALGIKPRFTVFSADSNVRSLVTLLAAGFTAEDFRRAAPKIPTHKWLRDKRNFSALTVPVMVDLLGDDKPASVESEAVPWQN